MPKNHPLQRTGVGERALAERVVRLERMVRDLAQASQAADRSVEDGAIEVYDDDDNLQTSLGRKKNDRYGAGYVGTAQPPTPSIPDVLAIPGGMLVYWDGTLEEATDIPIERVAIFASDVSGFKIDLESIEDPDPDDDGAEEVGAIYSDQGGTCVIPIWGQEAIYVRAVAISESGVASEPTVQIDAYASEAEIDFYVDEFVLTEAGAQDLTLTFEPIAFSEHVYWHVGGPDFAGVKMQDDVTWTRDEQVVSLTGLPVAPEVGDVVVVQYAYLVGQPAGNRITVQIISSDHEDIWTVEFRRIDDNGDERIYEVEGVNDPGPWSRQELGYMQLSDLVLHFSGPDFDVAYPNARISRTDIDGEDDEGTYEGHRYTLTDDSWTTLEGETSMVIGRDSSAIVADAPHPTGSYGDWNARGLVRKIVRAINMDCPPNPFVYERAVTWEYLWLHATKASSGEQYWNIPWSAFSPFANDIENGPYVYSSGYVSGAVPTTSTSGDKCGWASGRYRSGSLHYGTASTTSRSIRFDLQEAVEQLWGPEGGEAVPTPPPGYTIEWENEFPTVVSVEAALNEPTALAGTNEGIIYGAIYTPGDSFGPNPDIQNQWANTSEFDPDKIITEPYSGGAGDWNDITSVVQSEGWTWFLLVSEVLGAGVAQEDADEANHEQYRQDTSFAFRITVTPSRYRFVPAEDEPSLVLDIKAYVDPDEE